MFLPPHASHMIHTIIGSAFVIISRVILVGQRSLETTPSPPCLRGKQLPTAIEHIGIYIIHSPLRAEASIISYKGPEKPHAKCSAQLSAIGPAIPLETEVQGIGFFQTAIASRHEDTVVNYRYAQPMLFTAQGGTEASIGFLRMPRASINTNISCPNKKYT